MQLRVSRPSVGWGEDAVHLSDVAARGLETTVSLVTDGATGPELREIMVRGRWRTMGHHTLRIQALDGLAAARA